ncbi:MAG: hypothetical protein OXD29_04485 [Roseovarius sp.]|nr:hypothetical protein [Roseovarius sp.]
MRKMKDLRAMVIFPDYQVAYPVFMHNECFYTKMGDKITVMIAQEPAMGEYLPIAVTHRFISFCKLK